MFALWYLSLAVDEMRKHFGWTFLDIFYGKSAKAINSVPKNSSDTKATTILPSPQSLKTSIVTAVTATTTTTTPPPPPIQPLQTSFNKEITTISIAKPKLNEVEANLSINQTINKPIINVKEKPLVTPEVPQIPSTMPSTKPAGTTTATITLKPRTTTNASTCETNQSNINPLKSDNKSAMSLTNSINKMITSEKIPINNNKSIIPEKEKQTNRNDHKNVSGSKVNAKARNRNMLASLEEDFDNLASLNNGNKYKDIANDQNAKIKDMRSATTNFLNNEVNSVKKLDMSLSKEKTTMVDAAVLTKLEEGYAKLAASNSKSLLKKYLTKEIFDNLKNKKTPTFGSTLLDCIQSGLENHDSGVGIYAPDAEAYTVFADIFDPIIEDYHGGFKKTDKHPAKDFGNVACFTNLDPNNEYVISTRVRCGRSLQGYPFNPCLTEAQYKEMECKVASTLACLEGELKGKFYPLTGMDKAVQQQLIDDHFLFKEGDRFLQAANASRFWPTGRGIYHNDNKTFLVWCNEEDHLRIISMQMGGDLGEVYRRLVTAVNEIEKRLPFSHDNRLGFLTFCPTNLGTTIRASVHIKVPKLAANKAKLEEVAAKYHLQVRGTRGEHTEAEGGVYDISNKRRMGLTEFQAVKEMNDGIAELIKLEKSM